MVDRLLFVAGTTPQIITETLWVLATTGRVSHPATIDVVTTTTGKRVAEQHLLSGGQLGKLCADIGLAIPDLVFHLVTDERGQPLDDVRNTGDNTNLANSVMTIVRDMARDTESRIHASLSGGRKTMGFYMGYAMSLYGRAQDALYHVMVPGPFESAEDFFYIPSKPVTIVHRGKSLSTTAATIEIAEIPFLRLRNWIDEPILNAERVDFGAITNSVQAAIDPLILAFQDDDCVVRIGKRSIVLPAQHYAMYRVFAEVRARAVPGAGPDGIGASHCGWLTSDDFASTSSRGTLRFLAVSGDLLKIGVKFGYVIKLIARAGELKPAEQRKRLAKYFGPIFSNVRKSLTAHIADPATRRQFWLHTEGRNPARYGLLVDPRHIRLTG
jgi:CRISPR-associated protein (TIGR02584 family)